MQTGFIHLHVHPCCALCALPMPFSSWLTSTITNPGDRKGSPAYGMLSTTPLWRQPWWWWSIMRARAYGTCVWEWWITSLIEGNKENLRVQKENHGSNSHKSQECPWIRHSDWALGWCPSCPWTCKDLLHLVTDRETATYFLIIHYFELWSISNSSR